MARRPYNRFDKVEVRMQEGDYSGGIYGGVVTRVWNHQYEVRMTTLNGGDGGGPLTVHTSYPFLQPVPPRIMVEYKQFDLVEVWHRRGCWPAVITRATPHNQFHKGLADGTRLFVDESELRIYQAFHLGDPPMWHYYKL
ncbi:hypothetical protein L2E82_08917 [Cichorium intybus]|uniref:Uncharacterized protein n=1 Tax=Cichorium intybus TaxID=13427 RepID=A0ACB9G771_CICIN|nr:hypothetical protein L2E82_08917 [Cichorium intybus]